MVHVNTHIAEMAPYVLPNLVLPDGVTPISLAQNESPFPPSPKAIEAATQTLADAQLYPDTDWTALRTAIADVHALDPDMILCGMGSMELISVLMTCCAGPDAAVLSTAQAYAFFRTAAAVANAPFIQVSEQNYTVSVDALIDAVTEKTAMVCVANPGNPTGTRIPTRDLRRLRDALPAHVLLIIDEAYGEFADGRDASTFDMPASGNTVVLRTFSKVYGLAGMRIGWGVFPPDVARQMRKVLNPSNVSLPAQAAAVAAMRDQDYMEDVRAKTIARRDAFAAELRKLGFTVPASETNFALLLFQSPEAVKSADHALRQNGIILRGVSNYGLPHALRATIGEEHEMARVADVLRDWKEKETME